MNIFPGQGVKYRGDYGIVEHIPQVRYLSGGKYTILPDYEHITITVGVTSKVVSHTELNPAVMPQEELDRMLDKWTRTRGYYFPISTYKADQ
jgi:hypothetical protein